VSYYGEERRPSRGLDLRMVAAVVIALIGIVTYMMRTEINPVTGKKQHIALSVEQEKALGLRAAPEMAAKMGGAVSPERSGQARLVSEVGRRIVTRSDARLSPYADNFHFLLLNDPETVNAFALPGGQVFITRGLYEKLDAEAELAGVLGHEIGHVIGRHAAEHMAKGELGQLLTVAVGVGASDEQGRGRAAQMAAAMVNQMAQLKFSRNDESEADRFGLKFMAEAGYDPTAMLDLMRVLKEAAKGQHPPELLATHPLPDTRIEAIKAELEHEYPDGVPTTLTRGRRLRAEQPKGSRPDH
jgi:beta-barrel assembly-enhancing protease